MATNLTEHVDDGGATGRSRRRAMLLGAAVAVTAALVVAAMTMLSDEDSLVSSPRSGEFLFEEPGPPDPNVRSRVLAVNPMSGEVLWATDVPGHAWSVGFAASGLVVPYSGQNALAFPNSGNLRGTPGVAALSYDGEPSWQTTFRTTSPNTPSFVHLDDGDLLAAPSKWSPSKGAEQLVRINGNSGETVWSTDLGFAPDDLEVLGDRVVIFQATVGFVGVDLATGVVVWETEFGDTKWSMPPVGRLEDPIRSSDDTVYFSLSSTGASGPDHGGIVGVTTAGEITLEVDAPWQTLVVRVDGDVMITMENPQTLSRYSAESGELVWTRDGLAQTQSYETIGDTALIGDGSGRHLLGISVTTGEVLWRLESDPLRDWVSKDANHFYWWEEDREKNTLTSIDAASGDEQWSFTAPGLMRQEALIHNGIVFAALARDARYGGPAATGVFTALDAETGAELWTLDLEFSFEAMATRNDVLYITTTQD